MDILRNSGGMMDHAFMTTNAFAERKRFARSVSWCCSLATSKTREGYYSLRDSLLQRPQKACKVTQLLTAQTPSMNRKIPGTRSSRTRRSRRSARRKRADFKLPA